MADQALVTGGGGFLGQYIVEQLVARGDQVKSLARNHYAALDPLGVQQIQGDICDASQVEAAVQDCNVVYHVAAIAGIWGRWEKFHQINTVGTTNVLTACRKMGVEKLVYCSSPSVIFDGTDQQNVSEQDVDYPSQWLCHYPHTKAIAEQAVLAANGSSLRTCSLRPHLIWGPRDQHLIPRLVDRARAGKLRIVGSGQNLVDHVYVENAATAHLQAADALTPDSPIGGNAYFISQGEPVNCWDWINEILAGVGEAPVTRKISFKAAWTVGQLFEWTYGLTGRQSEPRMTRFLAAQLAKHHYYDISRARSDFGYEPKIGYEEGMQRMLDSMS